MEDGRVTFWNFLFWERNQTIQNQTQGN